MMILNEKYLNEIQKQFAQHIGIPIGKEGYALITEPGTSFCVSEKNGEILIRYTRICEQFRGIAMIKEELEPGKIIEEKRTMDSLAAFCDCSRNAVLKLNVIKEFIMDLAALGYDALYLYTEDTFEIEGEPYFGHLRGRYSPNEIKEADAFAQQFGIELIPAVQTLAHLNAIFQWKRFDSIRDIDDILLCGAKETYAFLDKMFASLRAMFSTKHINIGMDEAHMLGLGKYLSLHGYNPKMTIFLQHIRRVMEIVDRYGFEPIMWSDMFFKIASGQCTYQQLSVVTFDQDVLKMIPENMALAYWNYSPQSEEYYETMMSAHQNMGRKIIFTGGCRKWVGFAPNYSYSFEASRRALAAANKFRISDFIVTGWGDNGAEGSLYLMPPILTLFSERCYRDDVSDEAVNRKLQMIFGYSLEEYMLLEKPNCLPGNSTESDTLFVNPHKIILWNDPLMGLYDRHIVSGTDDYYKGLCEKLASLKDRPIRLRYVFETIWYLCDFLSRKAEIGNRIRDAYQCSDSEQLKKLQAGVKELISKLDEFHSVFRNNWLCENKIFGFEVQDIRFGSLRARLSYTEEILGRFLGGEVTTIPELEEPVLFMDCRASEEEKDLQILCNSWRNIVSPANL